MCPLAPLGGPTLGGELVSGTANSPAVRVEQAQLPVAPTFSDVIAEGVETEIAAQTLLTLGHHAPGYLFSPPRIAAKSVGNGRVVSGPLRSDQQSHGRAWRLRMRKDRAGAQGLSPGWPSVRRVEDLMHGGGDPTAIDDPEAVAKGRGAGCVGLHSIRGGPEPLA